MADQTAADSAKTGVSTKPEDISRPEMQRFEELKAAVAANDKDAVVWHGVLSEKDRKWNEEVARASLNCASLAAQFQAKFPESRHAAETEDIEAAMLIKAETAGSTEAGGRLDALVSKKLAVPGLGEDDRFQLRVYQVQSAEARMNGMSAAEKSAACVRMGRQAIQEFPKRSEPYSYMLHAADNTDSTTRRAVVDEVLGMPAAPDEVKQQAGAILRLLNLPGHPADIQFTALDGREVDLAGFKGRVVLVDFWATWCPPCVVETPRIKEAYEKFHSRGFEVVGISLDSDKSALEKFVRSKGLPWPQYYDGKVWENKFVQRYGFNSLPTMWLLDRNGNVADIAAGDGLEDKITRLLPGKETSAAGH